MSSLPLVYQEYDGGTPERLAKAFGGEVDRLPNGGRVVKINGRPMSNTDLPRLLRQHGFR